MYLDPGFGSMVIQLIIGGIAAVGTGFFLFRQRIKEFFRIRSNGESSKEVDDSGEQEKNKAQ